MQVPGKDFESQNYPCKHPPESPKTILVNILPSPRVAESLSREGGEKRGRRSEPKQRQPKRIQPTAKSGEPEAVNEGRQELE